MTPDTIKIISEPTTRDELRTFIYPGFEILKGVVDLEKKIMAVGGELHADEESALLQHDSKQQDLWGINLHLEKQFPDMVEFDSMINLRPSQNNRSRSVEDPAIRKQIINIVKMLVS